MTSVIRWWEDENEKKKFKIFVNHLVGRRSFGFTYG